MVQKLTRAELVWKAGVEHDCYEADEARPDMYRKPGSDSSDPLDETYPGTSLDYRVELGGH